jgi:imidazoleglycerol-phosphate dehydratase
VSHGSISKAKNPEVGVSEARTGEVARTTKETDIVLRLALDGTAQASIATGVGFLDHMLELFTRHGLFDLKVTCRGDLQVDAHHSTEDVGICLGLAIDQALGDRTGIRRYGHAILPMDESLVTCAVDLGGRAYFAWSAPMPSGKIGDFDSELVAEFWRAVATSARMNLHVIMHYTANTHHAAEAIFKGMARSIREAAEIDPRAIGMIPSTKGVL